MKIKISDEATYEIKFPEAVNLEEFNKVIKMLEKIKDFAIEFNPGQKPEKKIRRKKRKLNKLIELGKVYYNPKLTPKQRAKEIKRIEPGKDPRKIMGSLSVRLKKAAIKPQEVGIRKFPSIKERKHPELWR